MTSKLCLFLQIKTSQKPKITARPMPFSQQMQLLTRPNFGKMIVKTTQVNTTQHKKPNKTKDNKTKKNIKIKKKK